MGMDHPSDDEYDKERYRELNKERHGKGIKTDEKESKRRSCSDGKPEFWSELATAAYGASLRCFDDAYAKKGIENGVPRSPDVIEAEKAAAQKRQLARELAAW